MSEPGGGSGGNQTLCVCHPDKIPPHEHYPHWLRHDITVVNCQPKDGSICGKHPRHIWTSDLLQAWVDGHQDP